MEKSPIIRSKEGNVQVISLNRPEKRNAINLEMMNLLRETLDEVAQSQDVRSIILKGEGAGFCSGLDFQMLAGLDTQDDTSRFRHFLSGFQDVFNKLEAIEKPVIAALHGFVFGMGLELALAADFRIAAQGTKIAIQEVELGLIPDVGGTTRLTRTVGLVKAKEMIMLAKRISPEEAKEIHLVNEVTPEDELMTATFRWTEELGKNAPLAVGMAKKIIDRGMHLDKLSFMELEAYAQSTLLKTDDVKEGILAKIQKREPKFKGR
ncbi:MAG: enoyl-CoA hydratase [Armatimonadetes bacterium CG07_land_8_20_14_0_80_40_9]|nr:MAG: enoyl-CoA hydratase [Armatimonadetes bacterium CG07_land_8_20_14_0_80_40_9]